MFDRIAERNLKSIPKGKHSSLITLFNKQEKDEKRKFNPENENEAELITFFEEKMGSRSFDYASSFVKSLFYMISHDGTPNLRETRAFLKALSNLEKEAKAAAYKLEQVLSPKWKPKVQLNEQDREFMKQLLMLIMASTKVAIKDLPDQLPSFHHDQEVLTGKPLAIGSDFDLFITEKSSCRRLSQWLQQHHLIHKVQVYYAVNMPSQYGAPWEFSEMEIEPCPKLQTSALTTLFQYFKNEKENQLE